MLQLRDVTVKVEGEVILKNINLVIPRGETHILLGPNGSGKTTLLKAIMGMGGAEVEGEILLDGQNIADLSVDERARLGMGIALQKSPAVPEISLQEILQITGEKHGTDEMEEKIESLNCGYLLERGLNENFSGGEMKRSELLQLLVQDPKVVLVDEPESGVDLDNIVIIGEALKRLLKSPREIEKKRAALVITHTGHIMDYLNADRGYVLVRGSITCAGNPRDLFEEVNQNGFEGCLECQITE